MTILITIILLLSLPNCFCRYLDEQIKTTNKSKENEISENEQKCDSFPFKLGGQQNETVKCTLFD